MPGIPYDEFADIYDAWCDSAPVTAENRVFYVELMSETEGPVVELGVGNGRICIEVARRRDGVYGVDSSTAMLDLCRERAAEAGVLGRLTLVQGDFRDFTLPEPATLITIPFHSIGHMLTDADHRAALRRIHGQLAPGGRLVFDHFIFDPDYPEPPGVPHLRAEFRDEEAGLERVLWQSTTRDMERQVLHVLAWTDDLDERGDLVRRRYRSCDLRWITPEQSRLSLEACGFEIETVYGDFQRSPFTEESKNQIWVARRAAG